MEGTTVKVSVRYLGPASVRVTLDGRNADDVVSELPVEQFVFRDVAPGNRVVEVEGLVGYQETTTVLVATPTATTAPTPTSTPVPPAPTRPPLKLSTAAFSPGDPIPVRYTCDGEDISPALSWNTPPVGTQTLAVIMDDPDAPAGVWNHWVVFNLPSDLRELSENQPSNAQLPSGGVQGRTSFGPPGYGGPCPPRGPAHTYRFFLYALDTTLDLTSSADKQQVLDALKGHILAESLVTGTYLRGSMY